MRIFSLTLGAAFLLACSAGLCAADDSASDAKVDDDRGPQTGRLSFGWASVDITPEEPVAVAGQYHARITDKVDDRLTATALAIETHNGQGAIDQAVLVSCDLAVIRTMLQDRVRKLAALRLPDLDVEKIVLCATHTHTAPSITDVTQEHHPYDFMGMWAYRIPEQGVMRPARYVEFLAQRLAEAVVGAWKNRGEGSVSWALSYAVVGHNRRAVYADKRAVMYGDTNDPNFSHIEGPSDPTIDLLFFWNRDKEISGMAIAVPCPAQEVEGRRSMSADFWHDVRAVLRKRYGAELPILALCGASGDQSPHLLLNKQADARLRSRRQLERRAAIAAEIERGVELVWEDARRDMHSDLRFQHHVSATPLPVRKVTDARYEQALADYEAGKHRRAQLNDVDFMKWRVSRALIARYKHQQRDPYYSAEIHLLRLGDVAIATNPFELFLDYGLRIKARSPAEQTLVVQLAADGGGYVPTERAVLGGGYSARIDDGVVGPAGGKVLVDYTVQTIREMWLD